MLFLMNTLMNNINVHSSMQHQLSGFQFDMFLAIDCLFFDIQSFENTSKSFHNAIFHFFRSKIVWFGQKDLNQFCERDGLFAQE